MAYENWGYRWGGLVVLALAGAAALAQSALGAGWIPWAVAGIIFAASLPLVAPWRVTVRDGRLTGEGLFSRWEVLLAQVRWVRLASRPGPGPGVLELDLGPGRPVRCVCVYDAARLAEEMGPYVAHAHRTGT